MGSYEFVYTLDDVGYNGAIQHSSDQEAIEYWRSIERNGQIKLKSLKNPTGTQILINSNYGRTMLK